MSAPSVQRRILVPFKEGFHLRVISQFVGCAGQFRSSLRVGKDGPMVHGKSVTELMTLAVGQGEELILEAEGDDAAELLEALSALMEARGDALGESTVTA